MEPCPHCGADSEASAARCASCGLRKQPAPPRFHRRWMWIYAGATAALLALAHFAPVLGDRFLPLQVLPKGKIRLYVEGGLVELLAPVAVFAIVAAVIAYVARRSVLREIALGSALLAAVQWFIWILRVHGDLGVLITSAIEMVNDTGGMILPPMIGLLLVNLISAFVALGAAALAHVAVERLSGKAICSACDREYRIAPERPPACPECGQPTSDRKKTTRWSYVAISAGATALGLLLVVKLAGAPLGFYWSCDFAEPGETCQSGIDAYRRAPHGDLYFWREQRGDAMPGVILDPTRYILVPAALFAFGPFVVAWRLRRGRRPTSYWAALLAWPAGALAALVFLGFAQFDSVTVLSIRLHLLAGVPWCLAGVLGAWLGGKLGPQVDFAEELGIDVPKPRDASTRDYQNW